MIKKLLPIFISVFIIVLNTLCVNASENVLKGVNVQRGANSYNILLKVKKPVTTKKNIISENRIILNLKDITISNNVDISYNGHKTIDNVIIEPCFNNGVNVMLQGDNIVYSDIQYKEMGQLENVTENIQSSFVSLFNIFTGKSSRNRKFEFGLLGLFGMVILGEFKFIRSKYKELEAEKKVMMQNIELTKDFKDYLPGVSNGTIKKPYTTPIYKTRLSDIQTRKVSENNRFSIPKTMTLNTILKTSRSEDELISKIVNNAPVFGSLSGINNNQNKYYNISNPIKSSKIQTNIEHLKTMTTYYRNMAHLQNSQDTIAARLDKVL